MNMKPSIPFNPIPSQEKVDQLILHAQEFTLYIQQLKKDILAKNPQAFDIIEKK
jgi:hypothetical protein